MNIKCSQWFLLFTLTLLLASCYSDSANRRLLSQAASLMETRPDSALFLLDSVSDPQDMSLPARAEYALLLTQAHDKNYIRHTSDSLIRIAVDYYEDKGDKMMEAKSYFYLGCVYSDMENNVLAIDAFLEALHAMPANSKDKLLTLIYTNLATQYKQQDFYDKALAMNKKAYATCVNRGDSNAMLFPLRNMASVFLLQKSTDSALHYYECALGISEALDNSVWSSYLWADIANIYFQKEDYNKAYGYISKAMTVSTTQEKRLSNYLLKGKILGQLNKLDSARSCLLESENSHDIHIKTASFLLLYNLESREGNLQKAIMYNESYLALSDSIHLLKRRAELTRLMNEHAISDYTKDLTAKEEREKLLIIIGSLCVLGIFVFVFMTIDKQRKKRFIALQKSLMRNRAEIQKISQKQSESVEDSRGGDEDTVYLKRLFVQDLQSCTSLFKTTACYKKIFGIDQQYASGLKPGDLQLSFIEREAISDSIRENFLDVILGLKNLYGVTVEDAYYCILYSMGLCNSTVATCMGVAFGALRSRKSRIKVKLGNHDVSRLVFPGNSLN